LAEAKKVAARFVLCISVTCYWLQKQKELQEAAQKFEKASNQLADAKEKETHAEKGLRNSSTTSDNNDTKAIDLAWQEVLNNAVMKVL